MRLRLLSSLAPLVLAAIIAIFVSAYQVNPGTVRHKKTPQSGVFGRCKQLDYSFCDCMNWSKRISVKRNHRLESRRKLE